MSHRRKHRWFRRLALGLAFASIASPAVAQIDEGATGSSYVTAGGWAGYVDPATGVPLSAGIGGFESQPVRGEDVTSKAIAQQLDPPQASAGSKVDWDDGLSLAVGGIALALALGLAFGYLRRPKLAL